MTCGGYTHDKTSAVGRIQYFEFSWFVCHVRNIMVIANAICEYNCMDSYKNVKNVDKYVDNVDYSYGKTA